MKRFLFLYRQCNSGGVQSSFKNRIMALMKRDCLCRIIFAEGGSGLQNFSNIPHAICGDKEEIKRIIREEKYDFVDFINDLPGPDFFADLEYKGFFLFEIRGIRGYDKAAAGRILNKYIHAILVPSRFIYSFARREFRGARPVFILPNIVDLDVFKPSAGRHAGASGSGSAKKRIVIGWVGRIGKNKNWRLFIRIWKELTETRRDVFWEGWVIGDLSKSPELDVFKQEVKRHQLHQSIHVFDSVPHGKMPVFYRKIAESNGLLLSTSHTEGYQNAVIEAMACGCPVVSTRSGGNSDIIRHGVNGFLFHEKDSREAVRYIEALTTNPALRHRIIRQARRKVAAENNEDVVIDRFLKICDGLSDSMIWDESPGISHSECVTGPERIGEEDAVHSAGLQD